MQRIIHRTPDKNHARRLIAILMLPWGAPLTHVAKILCAARSYTGRWLNWFTFSGTKGLKSLQLGRKKRWPVDGILRTLNLLDQRSPQDFGYLRSRYSSEILTIEINKLFNSTLHPSLLRRWLPRAGIVWRRAAPTLHIRDPHKAEKMAAITDLLEKNLASKPVFCEDEVDIDLNPKKSVQTGRIRGEQKRVPTHG